MNTPDMLGDDDGNASGSPMTDRDDELFALWFLCYYRWYLPRFPDMAVEIINSPHPCNVVRNLQIRYINSYAKEYLK